MILPPPARRRLVIPLAAVMLAGSALLAGCGGARDPVGAWRSVGTSAPASPPASSPSAPERPARTEITLAFAGDVHFTGRTLRLLDHPDTAVGPYAAVLRSADFAMVNLETAVTGRGQPQPKRYHFRAPPAAYAAVRAAGVDLVSLANNHTLDYGRVGLADTLGSAAAAGMAVVGAGRDADQAYAPWIGSMHGIRVAVVAFSQVHELAANWAATGDRSGIAMAFDNGRAVAAVREARRAADLVIVFMHWGREGSPCPTTEMRTFAAQMADSGADIVVGTHAHTLLGSGWLGGTYVHYGLGNFVWYGASHSTDTGVLQLTVRDRQVIKEEFVPGVVSTTGQPVPVTGTARDRVEARLASAERCTGLADRQS